MGVTRGRLLKASLVFGTVLVLLNVLILFTARHSQRHLLLARLDQIPPETDCIFLGNSLVEAGCDPLAFRTAWTESARRLNPVNLALGATSPVEHYLILKRALAKGSNVKYVIYGFFDDQLNSAPRGEWADLVGNRALSYYFPDDAAEFYSPHSRLKRCEMHILGHIPMFSERSSLWGTVDLLRRSLADVGMPKHKMNRFGRIEDFSALEMKDTESFNRRCRAILNNRAGFSEPIRGMLQLARGHGVAVVFVEMPMPSRHRQAFYSSEEWSKLRIRLQALAAQEQALYVSACDWVLDDTQFEDATHLSEEGARWFSAELGKRLSAMNVGATPRIGEQARAPAVVP